LAADGSCGRVVVSCRDDDAAGEGGRSYVTPRTLMSILRLSQVGWVHGDLSWVPRRAARCRGGPAPVRMAEGGQWCCVQAVAKLRFDGVVSRGDVDTALSLMRASQASIEPEAEKKLREDPISRWGLRGRHRLALPGGGCSHRGTARVCCSWREHVLPACLQVLPGDP
jgi:hypothetical protein